MLQNSKPAFLLTKQAPEDFGNLLANQRRGRCKIFVLALGKRERLKSYQKENAVYGAPLQAKVNQLAYGKLIA